MRISCYNEENSIKNLYKKELGISYFHMKSTEYSGLSKILSITHEPDKCSYVGYRRNKHDAKLHNL